MIKFRFATLISDIPLLKDSAQAMLAKFGWVASQSEKSINGVRVLLRTGMENVHGRFLPQEVMLFLTLGHNLGKSNRPAKINQEDVQDFAFVQIFWNKGAGYCTSISASTFFRRTDDFSFPPTKNLFEAVAKAVEWLVWLDSQRIQEVNTGLIGQLLQEANEMSFVQPAPEWEAVAFSSTVAEDGALGEKTLKYLREQELHALVLQSFDEDQRYWYDQDDHPDDDDWEDCYF